MNDEDTSTLSLNADLYDPVANTFSSAGANASQRLYHSVALLLPDATVWTAGSNPSGGVWEPHMEIYSPSYLFTTDTGGRVVRAARPSIARLPPMVGYGAARWLLPWLMRQPAIAARPNLGTRAAAIFGNHAPSLISRRASSIFGRSG